eukprot:2838687-Ditylum_brightwellii.AAC.1
MRMENDEQDIMHLFMDLGRGIIGSNNQGNEMGPTCDCDEALVDASLYGLESDISTCAGVTKKTFRVWIWLLIDAIADLESEV